MNDIKKAALIKQMQAEFLKIASLMTQLEQKLHNKKAA